MHRRITPALIGLLTVLNSATLLIAQQDEGADSEFAEFQSAAERYRMTTGAGQTLHLLETPIMNWANPARNNELGSVFIWERDGRPLIVGTVFTYAHPFRPVVRTKHAFHSLSQEPLSASLDEQIVWRPASPGVQWRTSEGSPAAGTARRLVQMRALARRIEVRLTDDRSRSEVLRLLPQPLHRYAPAGSPAEDGAVFAFVTATDPEALLLIESHATEDGLKWRYAFARFHYVTLEATLDGDQVWSVEPEMDQRQNVPGATEFQERAYTTMLVGERPAE
jgi:hypothetical protein